MTDPRKLSQYIEPGFTDADYARQWEGIDRKLAAPPRRPRLGAVLALAATLLVAAAVVFFVRRQPSPSAWDGAVLDSGADQVSVALGDGSKIELLPASRVAVHEGSAHTVRLDLKKGSARFEVPHLPGRTFHVVADGVTVRVVGTRFSVAVQDVALREKVAKKVTVSVEEGVVEVDTRPGQEPARVRAGETWNTTVGGEATAAAVRATPPPPPAAAALPEAPAEQPAARAPTSVRAQPAEETAQELFERANAARQAGDAQRAASAYETLLARHPKDGRVGLAAFELGRLKMDQLGDLAGSVVALRRAVAAAPGAGFREDALARLVRAYGTMGDSGRCVSAQKAYLGSYPNGVHAGAVRKGCPGAP